MDGMHWIASTMVAAQARLESATTNLANAHVAGYESQPFSAYLTENGITITPEKTVHPKEHPSTPALPATDAAHEMVAVLEAQRNFETAQKVALSFDSVRTKEASDIGRAAS